MMVGPSSDRTTTVKLAVLGITGEAGAVPAKAPVPSGLAAGLVSTFDDGAPSAKFGSWIGAGDQLNGGKSMGKITMVQPGANGTKGALDVSGEVVPGGPFLFAGALYSPGSAPMKPADLSSKTAISFWAKGDGGTYTLLVLTASRNGQSGEVPAMTTFVAGPEWKQYTFPFSTFETDGSDLSGLGFIRVQQPGSFHFELDEVEFK